MPMNDLLNKKFFRLLSESSQVSNEVMQVAYDAFIKGIIEISSSEEDYSKVFRLLNHSRIELDSLKISPLLESGGGVVKSNYIQKALNFLNAEMDLLKLKIQYPESFPKTEESAFKFNLYITPKAKGLGIIGIAELVGDSVLKSV